MKMSLTMYLNQARLTACINQLEMVTEKLIKALEIWADPKRDNEKIFVDSALIPLNKHNFLAVIFEGQLAELETMRTRLCYIPADLHEQYHTVETTEDFFKLGTARQDFEDKETLSTVAIALYLFLYNFRTALVEIEPKIPAEKQKHSSFLSFSKTKEPSPSETSASRLEKLEANLNRLNELVYDDNLIVNLVDTAPIEKKQRNVFDAMVLPLKPNPTIEISSIEKTERPRGVTLNPTKKGLSDHFPLNPAKKPANIGKHPAAKSAMELSHRGQNNNSNPDSFGTLKKKLDSSRLPSLHPFEKSKYDSIPEKINDTLKPVQIFIDLIKQLLQGYNDPSANEEIKNVYHAAIRILLAQARKAGIYQSIVESSNQFSGKNKIPNVILESDANTTTLKKTLGIEITQLKIDSVIFAVARQIIDSGSDGELVRSRNLLAITQALRQVIENARANFGQDPLTPSKFKATIEELKRILSAPFFMGQYSNLAFELQPLINAFNAINDSPENIDTISANLKHSQTVITRIFDLISDMAPQTTSSSHSPLKKQIEETNTELNALEKTISSTQAIILGNEEKFLNSDSKSEAVKLSVIAVEKKSVAVIWSHRAQHLMHPYVITDTATLLLTQVKNNLAALKSGLDQGYINLDAINSFKTCFGDHALMRYIQNNQSLRLLYTRAMAAFDVSNTQSTENFAAALKSVNAAVTHIVDLFGLSRKEIAKPYWPCVHNALFSKHHGKKKPKIYEPMKTLCEKIKSTVEEMQGIKSTTHELDENRKSSFISVDSKFEIIDKTTPMPSPSLKRKTSFSSEGSGEPDEKTSLLGSIIPTKPISLDSGDEIPPTFPPKKEEELSDDEPAFVIDKPTEKKRGIRRSWSFDSNPAPSKEEQSSDDEGKLLTDVPKETKRFISRSSSFNSNPPPSDNGSSRNLDSSSTIPTLEKQEKLGKVDFAAAVSWIGDLEISKQLASANIYTQNQINRLRSQKIVKEFADRIEDKLSNTFSSNTSIVASFSSRVGLAFYGIINGFRSAHYRITANSFSDSVKKLVTMYASTKLRFVGRDQSTDQQCARAVLAKLLSDGIYFNVNNQDFQKNHHAIIYQTLTLFQERKGSPTFTEIVNNLFQDASSASLTEVAEKNLCQAYAHLLAFSFLHYEACLLPPSKKAALEIITTLINSLSRDYAQRVFEDLNELSPDVAEKLATHFPNAATHKSMSPAMIVKKIMGEYKKGINAGNKAVESYIDDCFDESSEFYYPDNLAAVLEYLMGCYASGNLKPTKNERYHAADVEMAALHFLEKLFEPRADEYYENFRETIFASIKPETLGRFMVALSSGIATKMVDARQPLIQYIQQYLFESASTPENAAAITTLYQADPNQFSDTILTFIENSAQYNQEIVKSKRQLHLTNKKQNQGVINSATNLLSAHTLLHAYNKIKALISGQLALSPVNAALIENLFKLYEKLYLAQIDNPYINGNTCHPVNLYAELKREVGDGNETRKILDVAFTKTTFGIIAYVGNAVSEPSTGKVKKAFNEVCFESLERDRYLERLGAIFASLDDADIHPVFVRLMETLIDHTPKFKKIIISSNHFRLRGYLLEAYSSELQKRRMSISGNNTVQQILAQHLNDTISVPEEILVKQTTVIKEEEEEEEEDLAQSYKEHCRQIAFTYLARIKCSQDIEENHIFKIEDEDVPEGIKEAILKHKIKASEDGSLILNDVFEDEQVQDAIIRFAPEQMSIIPKPRLRPRKVTFLEDTPLNHDELILNNIQFYFIDGFSIQNLFAIWVKMPLEKITALLCRIISVTDSLDGPYKTVAFGILKQLWTHHADTQTQQAATKIRRIYLISLYQELKNDKNIAKEDLEKTFLDETNKIAKLGVAITPQSLIHDLLVHLASLIQSSRLEKFGSQNEMRACHEIIQYLFNAFALNQQLNRGEQYVASFLLYQNLSATILEGISAHHLDQPAGEALLTLLTSLYNKSTSGLLLNLADPKPDYFNIGRLLYEDYQSLSAPKKERQELETDIDFDDQFESTKNTTAVNPRPVPKKHVSAEKNSGEHPFFTMMVTLFAATKDQISTPGKLTSAKTLQMIGLSAYDEKNKCNYLKNEPKVADDFYSSQALAEHLLMGVIANTASLNYEQQSSHREMLLSIIAAYDFYNQQDPKISPYLKKHGAFLLLNNVIMALHKNKAQSPCLTFLYEAVASLLIENLFLEIESSFLPVKQKMHLFSKKKTVENEDDNDSDDESSLDKPKASKKDIPDEVLVTHNRPSNTTILTAVQQDQLERVAQCILAKCDSIKKPSTLWRSLKDIFKLPEPSIEKDNPQSLDADFKIKLGLLALLKTTPPKYSKTSQEEAVLALLYAFQAAFATTSGENQNEALAKKLIELETWLQNSPFKFHKSEIEKFNAAKNKLLAKNLALSESYKEALPKLEPNSNQVLNNPAEFAQLFLTSEPPSEEELAVFIDENYAITTNKNYNTDQAYANLAKFITPLIESKQQKSQEIVLTFWKLVFAKTWQLPKNVFAQAIAQKLALNTQVALLERLISDLDESTSTISAIILSKSYTLLDLKNVLITLRGNEAYSEAFINLFTLFFEKMRLRSTEEANERTLVKEVGLEQYSTERAEMTVIFWLVSLLNLIQPLCNNSDEKNAAVVQSLFIAFDKVIVDSNINLFPSSKNPIKQMIEYLYQHENLNENEKTNFKKLLDFTPYKVYLNQTPAIEPSKSAEIKLSSSRDVLFPSAPKQSSSVPTTTNLSPMENPDAKDLPAPQH